MLLSELWLGGLGVRCTTQPTLTNTNKWSRRVILTFFKCSPSYNGGLLAACASLCSEREGERRSDRSGTSTEGINRGVSVLKAFFYFFCFSFNFILSQLDLFLLLPCCTTAHYQRRKGMERETEGLWWFGRERGKRLQEGKREEERQNNVK